MNPQEFAKVLLAIEETAKRAYDMGHADGAAGKARNAEQFKFGVKSKNDLKTYIEKWGAAPKPR